MGLNSTIEWVTATWNPLTGCTKISPGCKNCYAERMSNRLQLMGQRNYVNGFALTMHEHMLEVPLSWKKPQRIFVNSMSDLFHKDVSFDFIQEVFATMRQADWHTFLVLTKRAERLEELSSRIDWAKNVWQGVSVENADYLFRIDHLRNTGAKTKFLSVEPLLGPIPEMNLQGIDWVIVGGESGPKCRPVEQAWIEQVLQHCREQKVAFFFKQWGGTNKKKTGRELHGQTYDEYPAPVDQRHPNLCCEEARSSSCVNSH